MKSSALRIALIAVFGALQAVLSWIPYSIPLGVSGSITFGLIGGTLIGILLGPATGGLAVLIGSYVTTFLNPAAAIFGLFSPIPAFLGAVSAGSVKIRRGYIAGALILVSVLIFYSQPTGREVFLFPWLSIVAMVAVFSPLAHMAASGFRSAEPFKQTLAIALSALAGVMADHASGSAMAVWYFSIPSQVWVSVIPIYPIERIIALVIVTLIAGPVYYSLKRSGIASRIVL